MGLIEARIHNARVHAVAKAMGAEIGLHELQLTTVCGNCFIRRPKPTVENIVESLRPVLVSPTGCLHDQGYETNTTKTACGLEATGQDWWWPL